MLLNHIPKQKPQEALLLNFLAPRGMLSSHGIGADDNIRPGAGGFINYFIHSITSDEFSFVGLSRLYISPPHPFSSIRSSVALLIDQ